jgi:hypothetical protein
VDSKARQENTSTISNNIYNPSTVTTLCQAPACTATALQALLDGTEAALVGCSTSADERARQHCPYLFHPQPNTAPEAAITSVCLEPHATFSRNSRNTASYGLQQQWSAAAVCEKACISRTTNLESPHRTCHAMALMHTCFVAYFAAGMCCRHVGQHYC